jgi:hypothetical protein
LLSGCDTGGGSGFKQYLTTRGFYSDLSSMTRCYLFLKRIILGIEKILIILEGVLS